MTSESDFMLQNHQSSCVSMAIKADLLNVSVCEKVVADFAMEKSRKRMKGNLLLFV